MASEEQIKIECGDCGQQFDVDTALKNRMVECGECKNQFRVDGDSIVHVPRRHFPGEKTGDLSVFSKKIDRLETTDEVNFRTVAYDQKVDPNSVMPLGPKRVMAIFAGLLLPVAVILVYALGHDPAEREGLMLDVTQSKKFVLSGFTALISTLLLVYGCRKNRFVGVLLALIFGGAVVAMPFFYGEYFSPRALPGEDIPPLEEEKREDITTYKREVGYGAVESAIRQSGDPERVIGVVMLDAKREYLDTVRAYLDRVVESEDKSRLLGGSRRVGEESAHLLVFTNVGISMDELTEALGMVGTVEKVRDDLRVVEVRLDPGKVSTRAAATLQDENSPSFYLANYNELNHIDQKRQLAAIRRLGAAERVGRRADVVARLKQKLDENGYPYKEDAVRTLLTWSVAEDHAAVKVGRLARALMEVQKEIPQVYLDYLIKFGDEGSERFLLYAWKREPATQEGMMVRAGELGERAIIQNLPLMQKKYYKSAASILRKIGTRDAIPAIEGVMEKADEDQKKALKAAIDEIKSRG